MNEKKQMNKKALLGVVAVVLLVAAKSSKLDLLSLGLPLLFTRPVLTVSEFFRKKEDAK